MMGRAKARPFCFGQASKMLVSQQNHCLDFPVTE